MFYFQQNANLENCKKYSFYRDTQHNICNIDANTTLHEYVFNLMEFPLREEHTQKFNQINMELYLLIPAKKGFRHAHISTELLLLFFVISLKKHSKRNHSDVSSK